MKDGHSLFAEIHTHGVQGDVDVVVPHTQEAEVTIRHMNKNITCFLKGYLIQKAVDEDFIHDLLNQCICAQVIHTEAECKFDTETWEITTKEERERDENHQEMEEAAWYNNLFKNASKGKNDRTYAAPEAIYQINGGRWVQTLNERNNGNYKGLEGVETFQVGKPKVSNEIDVDEDKDSEMSDISKMDFVLLEAQFRALLHKAKGKTTTSDEESSQDSDDEEDDSSAESANSSLDPNAGGRKDKGSADVG